MLYQKIAFAVVTLIVLAGCNTATINVAEVANHARCQAVNPGVTRISYQQMSHILGSMLLNHPPAKNQSNADHHLYVVYAGEKPTPGYSLQLIGARVEGEIVHLNYTWQTPLRGTVQAQVITSPCSVVRLDARDDQVEVWIDGERISS